jgi:hypothetical protein
MLCSVFAMEVVELLQGIPATISSYRNSIRNIFQSVKHSFLPQAKVNLGSHVLEKAMLWGHGSELTFRRVKNLYRAWYYPEADMEKSAWYSYHPPPPRPRRQHHQRSILRRQQTTATTSAWKSSRVTTKIANTDGNVFLLTYFE